MHLKVLPTDIIKAAFCLCCGANAWPLSLLRLMGPVSCGTSVKCEVRVCHRLRGARDEIYVYYLQTTDFCAGFACALLLGRKFA